MENNTSNPHCSPSTKNITNIKLGKSKQFAFHIEAEPGTPAVLLGNAALALGSIHAGFGAAEGYPGTPSTEVIDTLRLFPEYIDAEWSVNEAVAAGVGVGRSLAGDDVLVTMKTPGLFQAADVVSSASFYDIGPGAMVLYIATDYAPSSTQNIIDPRGFLSDCNIPILEPRDHQDLYHAPRLAAELSREMGIPVAIVAACVLAHSEGVIRIGASSAPNRGPGKLKKSILLPSKALTRYHRVLHHILPATERRLEKDGATTIRGETDWGIIAVGASTMAIKEVIRYINGPPPHLLTLSGVFPMPKETIEAFCEQLGDRVVLFEEGGRFVESHLRQCGISVLGKTRPSLTVNTPQTVLASLYESGFTETKPSITESVHVQPVPRPPSICPGCPYRGITLGLQKLRKKNRLEIVFGDIGCSTLMHYLGVLDLNLCMGASESMRQGYVRSKPDSVDRIISLLGDSCECHTGLDASRNAVFRNIPGVKVILDNRLVAMTGGQETPTTSGRLDLEAALEGEGIDTKSVDAFDLSGIENALTEALEDAKRGCFRAIVVKGACLQAVPGRSKRRRLTIDPNLCTQCGRCMVCPGIDIDTKGQYHYTALCSNCGGNSNICVQRCRQNAIVEYVPSSPSRKASLKTADDHRDSSSRPQPVCLPDSVRVAIRGIGGQGNLFFGKVLSNVFLDEIVSGQRILKGETHGMAQLGGPVISTFAFGDVHSPVLLPRTADLLVAMETSEAFRPGFLDLLKPDGTLILNHFAVVPKTASPDDYPSLETIREDLSAFKVIDVNALDLTQCAGDTTGKSVNVAVIGILSALAPFSSLPEEKWKTVLKKLSKTAEQADINLRTFSYARAKYTPFV